MWVYPNLLNDEQWSSSSKQKNNKRKTSNVIFVIHDEDHVKTNALIDSKIEMSAMATHPNEEDHQELDMLKVTSKTTQK